MTKWVLCKRFSHKLLHTKQAIDDVEVFARTCTVYTHTPAAGPIICSQELFLLVKKIYWQWPLRIARSL